MAKRFPPEALEPTSLAQQRKASRPVSLSAPKKLTFPDPVAVQPSAIAHIAAARCGFDEGEMAVMLMARPVMAATRVFDFIQEPTDYTNVEPSLSVLLQQFSTTFVALGGNSAAVIDEWCRLNRVMVRDATLRALPLEELYSRAFIHFQYNHFNILLLRLLCTLLPSMWCWQIVVLRACCRLSNKRANSTEGPCYSSWSARLG